MQRRVQALQEASLDDDLASPSHPDHDISVMNDWYDLFLNNRTWAASTTRKDPDYFTRLAATQEPPIFYIGCCDSRLPLTSFTRSGPGHFFVHRNIANQVHMDDMNLLAALEYSVMALKVSHVVVAGHYRCGGIRAAVMGTTSGTIGNWVQPVRQMYIKNRKCLDHSDEESLLEVVAQMNVLQQVRNVFSTKTITDLMDKGEPVPTVHGVIIDLGHGHIHEIPLPLEQWRAEGYIPADFSNNGYQVGEATSSLNFDIALQQSI